MIQSFGLSFFLFFDQIINTQTCNRLSDFHSCILKRMLHIWWMQTPQPNITLEVCVSTIHSVLAAEEGGAMRLELCEGLETGGQTPSPGLFKLARKWTRLPLFVLVRPGTRDFCYSPLQKQQILEDIQFFKDLGADGIVSGALLPDGSPDLGFLDKMIATCKGLPFTFHRAADHFSNPKESIVQVRDAGVKRILSSGLKNKAIDSIDTLVEWQNMLGKDTLILAGGGVSPADAMVFKKAGILEVHGSFRKKSIGPMEHKPETPVFGNDFFDRAETDADLVREFLMNLSQNEDC